MEENVRRLLKPEYIAHAAQQWECAPGVTLIDEVENLVYDVRCGGRRRVLRVGHSSHRSEDDVLAELDWMSFLSQRGVRLAAPVASRNGRSTETIPADDGSYFVASVFERAPGDFIDTSDRDQWSPEMFHKWGKTIGQMHALTKQYDPRHLGHRRPEWDEDDIITNAGEYVPDGSNRLLDDFQRTLDRIRALPKGSDDYGLTHADLNPTNFFVHEGEITLFDFDDCCYQWFIADIASAMPFYSEAVSAPGWEERASEFFRHFMTGYDEENRLDAFWFGHLPDFWRFQNTLTLVFCYKHDIANTEYKGFFERVLDIHENGHPWLGFDFRALYESCADEPERAPGHTGGVGVGDAI